MSAPLFACMEQVDSHGKEFHEIWLFLENLQKIQLSLLTVITCILHEDRCTFMIISALVLPTMRNVSDKSC